MKYGHGWTFPLSLGLARGAGLQAFVAAPRVYAREAAITLAQARALALKQVPGGRVVSEELRHAGCGARGTLHFSFQIRRGRQAQEVHIDATTGMLKRG